MPKFPVLVERHLNSHPEQREPISRMLDLFDITWVDHIRVEKSEDSYYLLKPKPHTAELFGFEKEVLCVYSGYDRLEARTLYHAREVALRSKIRIRCELLYLVVIAPIENLAEQVAPFGQDLQQDWIIISFAESELRGAIDPWFLRRRFAEILFARDLFDMKQALVNDKYFFGRQSLVLDLRDRFIRGENSGVFGLRKTGKTSALFRLRRVLESDDVGIFTYVDAQSPAVFCLRWFELLDHVKETAARAVGVELPHPLDKPFTAVTALSRTAQALRMLIDSPRNKGHRLLLVIDEIEHLMPDLSPAEHWKSDYLQFWKLLRAIQTEERRFSFILAGVNASVVEATSVQGADNPLFSLIGIRYMPPFSLADTREMVQSLGRRMGLGFDASACQYLQQRYGGHPLLVRLACSWEHQLRVVQSEVERPIQITRDQLEETERERERTVAQYVRHMLDVLHTWYPREYELLTLLAEGGADEFREFADAIPELVVHLRAYGLVSAAPASLAIPVVGDYLVQEQKAARMKEELVRRLVSKQASPRIETQVASSIPSLADLLSRGEGTMVEFKSTARVNLRTKKIDEDIIHSLLKSFTAFLNSDGGHLVVGVADDGSLVGSLALDQFPSRDVFQQWLATMIRERVGNEHTPALNVRFEDMDGSAVIILDCKRGAAPAYLLKGGKKLFYCRSLSTTQELGVDEIAVYLKQRFHS
jgi:hypothetical protein